MCVNCTATLLTVWLALNSEYRRNIKVRLIFGVCSCFYIILSILGIFGKTDTDKKILNEYYGYSYRGVNNEIINQLIDSYRSSVIIQSCKTCVFFVVAIALLYYVFSIKKLKNKSKHILAISVLLLFVYFVIIPTSYSSIQKYSFRESSKYETFSKCVTFYKNGIPEISYKEQKIAVNSGLECEIIDTTEFNILGLFLLLEIVTVFVVLVLLNRSSCKETNTIEIVI